MAFEGEAFVLQPCTTVLLDQDYYYVARGQKCSEDYYKITFWLTQTNFRHYFQHLSFQKNKNKQVILSRQRLLRFSLSKIASK